jgi:hypothetical protein
LSVGLRPVFDGRAWGATKGRRDRRRADLRAGVDRREANIFVERAQSHAPAPDMPVFAAFPGGKAY